MHSFPCALIQPTTRIMHIVLPLIQPNHRAHAIDLGLRVTGRSASLRLIPFSDHAGPPLSVTPHEL